jgi:hypothetical protein
MTKVDLELNILQTLANYWRIKAANTIYRTQSDINILLSCTMDYSQIPSFGRASNFLLQETLSQSVEQLNLYIQQNLAKHFFFILFSHLETYLSTILQTNNCTHTGPFGFLQKETQKLFGISDSLSEVLNLDELRERRNCIVHNAGKLSPKYISAANKVYRNSNGVIDDPNNLTYLDLPEMYLAYCSHIMIVYADLLP